ncbi:hypothetical protein GCM10010307_84440 [Streptomyces vastus]|uniref:Uncharacterized protein n=1 Tax=Streptomyces vastus TaxID=285451 RepID=A0ABP6ECF2_9ACTN
MTTPVRVCRHCQEAITDPETNGVIVAHELGNSGPGWDIWAHRWHAEQVQLINDDLLRIMLRIWAAQSST